MNRRYNRPYIPHRASFCLYVGCLAFVVVTGLFFSR